MIVQHFRIFNSLRRAYLPHTNTISKLSCECGRGKQGQNGIATFTSLHDHLELFFHFALLRRNSIHSMQTATFELLLFPQDAVRDLLACPALLFYLRKEVMIVVLIARHNEGIILELPDVALDSRLYA